jgi:hypothetical protein
MGQLVQNMRGGLDLPVGSGIRLVHLSRLNLLVLVLDLNIGYMLTRDSLGESWINVRLAEKAGLGVAYTILVLSFSQGDKRLVNRPLTQEHVSFTHKFVLLLCNNCVR